MKILFAFIVLSVFIPTISTAQHSRDRFSQITQNADSVIPPEWFDPSDDNADERSTLRMAKENSKRLDSTLNFVYQTILNDYKDDTDFIPKFKLSEVAWLKYRDAELGAILPAPHNWNDETPPQRFMYNMDEYNMRDALTKRRVEELMMWYNGAKIGCDNCSFRWSRDAKH